MGGNESRFLLFESTQSSSTESEASQLWANGRDTLVCRATFWGRHFDVHHRLTSVNLLRSRKKRLQNLPRCDHDFSFSSASKWTNNRIHEIKICCCISILSNAFERQWTTCTSDSTRHAMGLNRARQWRPTCGFTSPFNPRMNNRDGVNKECGKQKSVPMLRSYRVV